MSGLCQDRVVVVTGAGRRYRPRRGPPFAGQGAKVVVNDLAAPATATARRPTPAAIVDGAGQAARRSPTRRHLALDGAENLIDRPSPPSAGLDVLVNNAGILRDKMIMNMEEAEWDSVIRVHLKGTFDTTHHAAAYWRGVPRPAADRRPDRQHHLAAGLYGSVGQGNYGAAKAGIASFTIITARELGRYGVTVNAIAPDGADPDDRGHRVHGRRPRRRGRLQRDGPREHRAPGRVAGQPVVQGHHRAGVLGVGRTHRGARGLGGRPSVDKKGRWDAAELTDVIPDLVAKAAPNADGMGARP